MKTIIFLLTIIGISLFAYSCSSKPKEENGKIVSMDPNDLIPGPIQHSELTGSQLEKIKSIHKAFEEVYPITLEATITNFKRDVNIDQEINLWITMKETFEYIIQEKKYSETSQRKEVFKTILMRTMMQREKVKNNADVNVLKIEDIEYILKEFETRMSK